MKLFDHKNKLYIGSRSPNKMRPDCRKAYRVFHGQKKRTGVEYTSQEFIYWYIHNFPKKMYYPHVGRINHSKKYSFSNIFFQTITDNSKERNARLGNPGKTHKKCLVIFNSGKIKNFKTKKEAAEYLGISEKTVYNHANKITKESFKYGPSPHRGFTVRWTK